MSTAPKKTKIEEVQTGAVSELPEGWAFAALGDVVSHLVDGSHNPPPKKSSGVPMLSARNIEDGRIVLNDYRFISERDFAVEDGRTKVRPGDVLLTIVGSIGRSAVVPRGAQPFALQRSVAVLKPHRVDEDYLMYVFRSPPAQEFFEENGAGTAQKGVYLRTLSRMPIRIAPISEQKRIAAIIDQLLAVVEGTEKRLENASKILEHFRQAVLSAACSGRLTEDWRQVNNPAPWGSTPVREVILEKPRNGLSIKAVDYKTPIRSLTLTATTSGRFDGAHFKYLDVDVPPDSHLWLKKGDILLQRGNTEEYVGVPAIYDGADNAYIYPDLMIKIRPREGVLTKFLWITLADQKTRQYFRDNAIGSQGTMPKITRR